MYLFVGTEEENSNFDDLAEYSEILFVVLLALKDLNQSESAAY